MPPEKKNKSTKQDEKAERLSNQEKARQLAKFEHLTKSVLSHHNIYNRPDLGFLREFVDYVEDHRDVYPRTKSLEAPASLVPVSSSSPIALTSGLVQSLASHTGGADLL